MKNIVWGVLMMALTMAVCGCSAVVSSEDIRTQQQLQLTQLNQQHELQIEQLQLGQAQANAQGSVGVAEQRRLEYEAMLKTVDGMVDAAQPDYTPMYVVLVVVSVLGGIMLWWRGKIEYAQTVQGGGAGGRLMIANPAIRALIEQGELCPVQRGGTLYLINTGTGEVEYEQTTSSGVGPHRLTG